MAKENEDTQKQAPKKSKLMLIIVVLVVLVLVAGGVFMYLTVLSKPAVTQTEDGTQDPANQNGAVKSGEMGVMYDLPPFIVNLSDPTGTRYLKVGISVELSSANQSIAGELDKRLPKIKDAIIAVLSSKTLEEIQTPQGKISLKQELLRRINAILTSGKILDLYLTDFVVQ